MAFEFELPPAPTENIKVNFGEADLVRRSASAVPAPAQQANRSCQADRCVEMHRLQGVSGGVS